MECVLSSGYENILLVSKAYKEVGVYSEKQLLSFDDYRTSNTFKAKEIAIKKWGRELEAIKEQKLFAARFVAFHC